MSSTITFFFAFVAVLALIGGAAWLVVQRNLGSDSLARWLIERGYPTRRIHAERGYRLLEVDTAPTGTDQPWPS